MPISENCGPLKFGAIRYIYRTTVIQVVGEAAEGVNGEEVRPQLAREQEGDEREVLAASAQPTARRPTARCVAP